MPGNLDLDRIKADYAKWDAYMGDDPDKVRCLANKCAINTPGLIAEVERLRQQVTDLQESNNRYEQQARDAKTAHRGNGKILEAVQLALVRSEEEVERLEREIDEIRKGIK